jgi:hypothetical protein
LGVGKQEVGGSTCPKAKKSMFVACGAKNWFLRLLASKIRRALIWRPSLRIGLHAPDAEI